MVVLHSPTVAGFTNTNGERQSFQTLDSAAQKARSSDFSRIRFWVRA